MQPGYYWADRRGVSWRIVEVVRKLQGHVLDRGFATRLDEYTVFVGPLPQPPSADAVPAWTVKATMRRAITEE